MMEFEPCHTCRDWFEIEDLKETNDNIYLCTDCFTTQFDGDIDDN